MNIFPLFQTVLYVISSALLYPVVVLLIGLCIWIVIYTGGFIGEWIRRRQKDLKGPLFESMELISTKESIPPELASSLSPAVISFIKDIEETLNHGALFWEERIEELIQRKEQSLLKEVEKINMIVRIGPSLGLMGTLIPMGNGLAGLTQGNIAQLSSNLILAFTTTVVGIALGISAYFFSAVKGRWMTQDMLCIELIAEMLTKIRFSNGEIQSEISTKKTIEQAFK